MVKQFGLNIVCTHDLFIVHAQQETIIIHLMIS